MIGKEFFSGPEVEGRLYGLLTLFCRVPGAPGLWRTYPHIYICTEVYDMEGFHWNQVRTYLQLEKIVTLELSPSQIEIVPEDIFKQVHVQLVLNIPEFSKLKDNDSLKVVTAPFTTYNVVKCSMQRSNPEDYINDKEVK